jgi:DNA replication protein DnaC
MLANTTIEGLKTLRLDAMAAALAEQHQQAAYAGLGFDERLGLLVDRELTERSSRRLERCLKAARLRTPATIEDIDFRHPRGLDRAQILTLAQAHWAENHHPVVITGPTGAGKTYLACALAHAAIRNGHTALYLRAPRMFDDLAIARADGRLARLMATWARTSVLVIDDLLLRPLTGDQAADLLEVVEDRARLRSTIITSQLPVSHWHEAIGDPTIADVISTRCGGRAGERRVVSLWTGVHDVVRLLAEELFFVVGAEQEGEAVEVASQLADAVGGVAGESGERFAQLVVAGGEPVIDELQQFGEFGDVSGGELDARFGWGHRRAPSGSWLLLRGAVRGRPRDRGGAAGSRCAAG